ncbi:unnamed protein product [Rhizophagus irregularis]|nr:unnamed protein product [Rhizophagus irregularis]
MVKTNYSGLNPIVVQALNNLQYRHSGEMPEMWCSHIHYPFKKLLEYNQNTSPRMDLFKLLKNHIKMGNLKLGNTYFIFIALYATP